MGTPESTVKATFAAVMLAGLLSGCAYLPWAGRPVTRTQLLTAAGPVASPTSPFQADCGRNVAWALAAAAGADLTAMEPATLRSVFGPAAARTYQATLNRYRDLAHRRGVTAASRALWPRILAGCAQPR